MNCHDFHETNTVDTLLGKMEVYNWGKYRKKGCPGNDPVSKELTKRGLCHGEDSRAIETVLDKCRLKHKLFLDFGCHIGWFSLLAAKKGFSVIAFDSQPHISLMYTSIDLNALDYDIHVSDMKLDENLPPAKIGKPYREIFLVRVAKETEHVLNMLSNLLDKKKIRYLYVDGDGSKLLDYGYIQDGKLFTRPE